MLRSPKQSYRPCPKDSSSACICLIFQMFKISFGKGLHCFKKKLKSTDELERKSRGQALQDREPAFELQVYVIFLLELEFPDHYIGFGAWVVRIPALQVHAGIRQPPKSCLPHGAWPVGSLALNKTLVFARGCPGDGSRGISACF